MNKSILIAVVIAVVAGGWILSGQFANGARDPQAANGELPIDTAAAEAPEEADLPSVRVAELVAQPRQNRVIISGRTLPSREVIMRAETDGRLDEVYVARGDRVTADQVLGRLSMDDRAAYLAEAEAILRQREIEFAAADSLQDKGFRSETNVAAAAAQLDSARAVVERMRVDISHTEIRAPFDGLISEGHVELGDFLSVGDPAGTIIDLDPIIVVGYATELEVPYLNVGAMGEARLVAGPTVQGVVSYVSPSAEPNARTFRFELEVPNPDYAIRAGLTSEIVVASDANDAHLVPSSIISLADDGSLGVKVIDDTDTVRFAPVRIVEDTRDGLWVEGLPERVTVITVGQDFVIPGQQVRPMADTATARAAS